jgi:tetratricopeptide (TPR) repeat protein
MSSQQLPSAQEIEELVAQVRSNPGSPAALTLCRCYMELGRPRDAAAVAAMSIETAGENIDTRLLLSQAYAAQHQWKEAQSELLKIVKTDRSNRVAFALLGEVLLRRNDYERAVPVLQHAQNLDPTSSSVLVLLKRARANAPLDPPIPVPTPQPPRGNDAQFALPKAPPRSTPPRSAPRSAPPSPPGASIVGEPKALASPPSQAPSRSQNMAAVAKAAAVVSVPSIEGVRPKLVAAKQQNAAAAALQHSASVGENYINDLLTGGLLDVGGIVTPELQYDLRPDRRWGRTARKLFAILFVLLFASIGGGTAWYFWAKAQRAEQVAKLQKDSRTLSLASDYAGYEESLAALAKAIDKDPRNPLSNAYAVDTMGLEALLYGTDSGRIGDAIRAAKKTITKETDAGAGELTIGTVAFELSRLDKSDKPTEKLASINEQLDTFLKTQDATSYNARMATWLKGRALAVAGQRKASQDAMKKASDGDSLVIAMIERADALIDNSATADGLAMYEKVLATKADHPLALLGRALAKSETITESAAALDDINVKLDKPLGPRMQAYRELATASAQLSEEDYPRAFEALGKATGVNEPRFLARVAYLYWWQGNFAVAAKIRSNIQWITKAKPDDDPSVQIVDAGLLLASGLPQAALEISDKLSGPRAKLMSVYALFDSGKYQQAASTADELLTMVPNHREGVILREQARMLVLSGTEKEAAQAALEKFARAAKSRIGRHALGQALYLQALRTSSKETFDEARRQLTLALEGITSESPHPLAYRTHTLLAELAILDNNVTEAGKHLDEATKLNAGYLPARGLGAALKLRGGDADAAIGLLGAVAETPGAMTPKLELVLAEALVSKKTVTTADRARAVDILQRIKDSVTPTSELVRVAALVDPKMSLNAAAPAPDVAAPMVPTPNKRPTRRPSRRRGR